MRASRFNQIIRRRDGRHLLFNLRSGGIAEIDAHTAECISEGIVPPQPSLIDSLCAIDALVEADEIDALRRNFELRRGAGSTLPLTIAPTLDCNFSCDYCYQDAYRSPQAMTDETAAALVNFIHRELQHRQSKRLAVTWYGGEPLLEKGRISSLMTQLKDLTGSLEVEFPTASIVTNGLLLDEDCAQILQSVGVQRAQISVDSLYYELGSKRGALLPGSKQLSPILENAIRAKRHMEINFRINVSKRNESQISDIIRVMRDQGLDSQTYIARVEDADGESGYQTLSDGTRMRVEGEFRGIPIVSKDQNLMSRKDVARLELTHFFSATESALGRSVEKLKPKTHYCSATTGELLVVDPAGNLSHCWHSAGVRSESIGSVFDVVSAAAQERSVRQSWHEYSPFTYRACRSCEVLPLCMGGCSHPRVFFSSPHAPCEAIKYQIREALDIVANAVELPTN